VHRQSGRKPLVLCALAVQVHPVEMARPILNNSPHGPSDYRAAKNSLTLP